MKTGHTRRRQDWSLTSEQEQNPEKTTLKISVSTYTLLSNSGNEYKYINNSRHLAQKYAEMFVRRHYMFREVNSFPRAKLEENCELRGADNVQGQISEHIFKAKWRLLWLLSFKYFSQHVATSLSI